MSNSKNGNLEDVSKGNDESAPRANDSASNKKTRFTKSKSISEVFKELENEEPQSAEFSNDLDNSSVDEIIPVHADSQEDLDSSVEHYDDYGDYEDSDDFDDTDEIIPIHNEYRDLDKSEALADESVEGGIIINPDSDDSNEVNVKESIDFEIEEENADSVDGKADSDEFSESLSVSTDFEKFDESLDGDERENEEIVASLSDNELADEDIEEKIGKSSAQGVLINDKDKASDDKRSINIFNASTIISVLGFIVGLAILLIGITYYASSSERVVDNVLSGETAGLAIFLVIIGFIIIAFSLLKFFSSSKSSFIIDTFNSIKSIDYDEISEDVVSRDDFDAIFGIFKRKKDSNFSDKDKSVDSSNDLNEKNQDDEDSDGDISAFYSDSNLTSRKNQSSFKEHENADSTENSQDYDDGESYDDGVDEIIPIHSELNEQSDEIDGADGSDGPDISDESVESLETDLEDKYSKYDFEEDSDEDYPLVEENFDDQLDTSPAIEEEYVEEIQYDAPDDSQDSVLEDSVLEDAILEDSDDSDEDFDEEVIELKKMDGLEDKYSKYDFEEDFDEEEESVVSKPKFKRSVDLSQFENQESSQDELAEKQRKAEELAEKKRRIIEGTNFDNSLRKE